MSSPWEPRQVLPETDRSPCVENAAHRVVHPVVPAQPGVLVRLVLDVYGHDAVPGRDVALGRGLSWRRLLGFFGEGRIRPIIAGA